jgi:hypothetical protein
LITIAGNPVLSAPNGPRLSAAFEKLDFMLSIDIYRNETTRHADIILPGPFAFERDHMDVILGNVSVRNFVQWSPRLFEPEDERREEWVIFDDLLRAMNIELVPYGLRELINGAAGEDKPITPERMADVLIRLGSFGDQFGQKPDGLTLEKLKAAPHGIDLGPLRTGGRERKVKLPGHRIRAAHEALVVDVERLRGALGEPESDGLRLIAAARSAPTTPDAQRPCSKRAGHELYVPARRRASGSGRRLGEIARVAARRVRLRVTDVMPGVVSLPRLGPRPRGRRSNLPPEPGVASTTSSTTPSPILCPRRS